MEQAERVLQYEALPLEAEQLAGTYQLGVVQAVYKAHITLQSIFLWVVVGIVLGGICIYAALNASTLIFTVILFLLGLLFIGMILYAMCMPLIYRAWRVYVCADGFIFKRGRTIDAFRWDQIEAMWQAVTKHYRNRVYMGTSYKYTIRRQDGVQVVFDNKLAHVEQLGKILSRQIMHCLWPQTMSAYRAGHTIPFGPFSVSLQGVSNGKELLSWSEVEDMNVRQGRVVIRKEGKWRDWSPVMVRRIPNMFVFMALVQYILKRAK